MKSEIKSISNRINWLDVAKGIGIFLVILSHLPAKDDPNQWLFTYIFSFHMPLFFFISGILFSNKYNFIDFVKRKFKTILVPFYVFMFICLIQSVISQYPNILIKDIVFTYGTKLFGYGIGMYGYYNGPIWFLGALFYSEIYFYLVTKLNAKFNNNLIMILTILIGLLGVIFVKVELPFGIRYFFENSIFLGSGYLLKKPLFKLSSKLSKIHCILIFIISTAIVLPVSNMNIKVLMCDNALGNLPIFFICAILGIASVFSLSILLKDNKVLQFYGANSIIILCLHLYFNRMLFPFLFNLIGIDSGFKDTLPGQLTILVLVIISMYPVIKFCNKYLYFLFGKSKNK